MERTAARRMRARVCLWKYNPESAHPIIAVALQLGKQSSALVDPIISIFFSHQSRFVTSLQHTSYLSFFYTEKRQFVPIFLPISANLHQNLH